MGVESEGGREGSGGREGEGRGREGGGREGREGGKGEGGRGGRDLNFLAHSANKGFLSNYDCARILHSDDH